MEILLKIYKLSMKIRRWLLSVWLSYSAGMITEYISDSETIKDVLLRLTELNWFSVKVFALLSACMTAVWIISILFEKVVYSKSKEKQFYELMKSHTADYLNATQWSRLEFL